MTQPRPAYRAMCSLPLLAVVVVLAAACGDNNKTSGTTAPSTTYGGTGTSPSLSPTTPRPTTRPPVRLPPTRAGSLVLGPQYRDLYPLLKKSLVRFNGQQVTAVSVRLLSIAGSEAFWAGRSPATQVLVHVRLKGLAPPNLSGKKRVSFVGQLLKNSKDAARQYGVAGAATALFNRQGAHVDVSIADLKFH